MTEQHCTGCSGVDYLGRPCRDLVSKKAAAAERMKLRAWAEKEHAVNCDSSPNTPFIKCRSVWCTARSIMLGLPWDSDLETP